MLKRTSVLVTILLTMVTLGFYYPIWFLRRRAALNQLDSPRKIHRWPFVLLLGFHVVRVLVDLSLGTRLRAQLDGPSVFQLLLALAGLPLGIMLIVQAFFVKDVIEDHLSGTGDDALSGVTRHSTSLSGLMTFFFGIFYLQHVINTRIISAP